MSPVRLVALAGVSGAGKDAAAAHLVARHGFERLAIADPLKEAMMELFALTREQLWGEGRNVPDPRLGHTPRALYQRFGEACREIDPDVWLRPFRMRATALLSGGDSVVCTDLRTRDELRMVRDLGGSVWLLRRPGAGAPGTMALDRTETELPAGDESSFDEVIWNDGSLDLFHDRLDHALAGSDGITPGS